MKITQIDIYRFNIPMEPFTIATGTMDCSRNMLLRVHTDSGITGIGECSPFPFIVGETQDTCIAMARDFANVWKEKDPLDIPARMQELHRCAAGNYTAKSAFDMALYDIAAKAANQPLYKFLGGEERTVETDITIGIDTAEKMAAQAREFKAAGATMIKVKLGKQPAEDLDRIRSIRHAVGDKIALRVDANQGWTFDEASQMLNSLGELKVQFCEQPMRTWYNDLLPALREQSPIPIMADESCYTHHDARQQLNSGSADYLNIKLAKAGGLLEAMKIHEVAQNAGAACMIGGMLESRIGVTANLHLAYACPGISFYDLDSAMTGQLIDPVQDGVIYDGFFLSAPDLPGIGVSVDPAFLHQCESITV